MTRPQALPRSYRTDEEILANALISDRAECLRIDQLAPSVQAHIEGGRKAGLHLVSVRWPTGQLALMFCEPGSEWPSPEKVITAYRQCLTTSEVFPNGVPS
jgi:hypothetical protein